jgi:pyruvate dehydrogenase E1 component
MLAEQQDEYFYITLMNENYAHPDMPEGATDGIIKGMYLFRDGADIERWNRFHPEAKAARKPWVTQQLEGRQGPAIAATDYVRAFANQIREYVPMRYSVLGTDGYGRSDTRENLRRHFEVDRYYVAHAAVAALAAEGKLTAKDVARALKLYKLDTDKPNPLLA